MKNYVVGNWKMNQDLSQIHSFFSHLEKNWSAFNCETWLAPQFIHLSQVLHLAKDLKQLAIGAQNCSPRAEGASTGEVSAAALKDLGADFVIIGHSERRQYFHENNLTLNQKVHLALEQNLKVIFCVGETLEERGAQQAQAVVKKQLLEGLSNVPSNKRHLLLVAYEPVWAIGTGKSATPQLAQDLHSYIRELLTAENFPSSLPLLYGGSVKGENIAQLLAMPDIQGALVGGASLSAPDYLKLCQESSQ